MGFPEGLSRHLMLIQNIPSIHLGETLWLGVVGRLTLGASYQAGRALAL